MEDVFSFPFFCNGAKSIVTWWAGPGVEGADLKVSLLCIIQHFDIIDAEMSMKEKQAHAEL